MAPKLEYWLYVDEDLWTSMHELKPGDLLEHWIEQGQLKYGAVSGSFVFFYDGKPWNDECLDEVYMSRTWLQGVEQLLQGRSLAQVWPWEESQMTLIRRGDRVEMFDVHHSGHMVNALVSFDLRELALVLAETSEALADFFDEILVLARDRVTPEQLTTLKNGIQLSWREGAAKLRELSDRPIPDPPADDPGLPPELHLAIQIEDRERFTQALSEEGPDRVYQDESPLRLALQLVRKWAVTELLAAGADPNAIGRHGMTPLLAACQGGKLDFVEQLLEAGADPLNRGEYQYTPLQQTSLGAIYGADVEPIVDRLVAAGAKLDLFSAIGLGRATEAQNLADQAPQFPDILGLWMKRLRQETFRKPETIEDRMKLWRPVIDALKAAGASPNSPGERWQPMLHEAILSGETALAEVALELGADPLHKVRDQTALAMAEHYRQEEIAERLRKAL